MWSLTGGGRLREVVAMRELNTNSFVHGVLLKCWPVFYYPKTITASTHTTIAYSAVKQVRDKD